MDPASLAEDKIYIAALVKEPSWLMVQIGGDNPITTLSASQAGMNTFEVTFNRQRGNTTFSLVRDKMVVAYATGPAITADCADGISGQLERSCWVELGRQ